MPPLPAPGRLARGGRRATRRAGTPGAYWARPLPGFGDPAARVMIVGLAPAAHGGNRTGRIFTGDRSGDWLFAALHRTGFANQPHSVPRGRRPAAERRLHRGRHRCAPPANRPTPDERDNCLPYLAREIELLPESRDRRARVLCVGRHAAGARHRGIEVPRPRPRFGHGAEAAVGGYTLVGCFHPSQQNTFTGKLTEEMTDSVLARAQSLGGRR